MDNQNNPNINGVNQVPNGVTPPVNNGTNVNIAPPVMPAENVNVAAPQIAPQPNTVAAPQSAPQQSTIAAPDMSQIATVQTTQVNGIPEVNNNGALLSPVEDPNKVVVNPQAVQANSAVSVTTSNETPEQIAAGIQSGSFVNAVQDPNAMINGGKVGTTISDEDKILAKKAKKNVKVLIFVLVLLVILGGGGYFFYSIEFTTANKRIDAVLSGINNYISPYFRDASKRIGTYELDATIKENTDKYGVKLSGSYGYSMGDYVQINGNISSIVSNDELLGKNPIKYYFYIYDSKLYVRFEDLYENFIHTDFPLLDGFDSNFRQNSIDFAVLQSSIHSAIVNGLHSVGAAQSIESVNINGSSKTANVVTFNINKNTLRGFKNGFYNTLRNSNLFLTNYANLIGSDAATLKIDLTKQMEEQSTFEGNINVRIYSALFRSDFYGIDVSYKQDNTTYKTTIVPIANGYKFVVNENNTKVVDLDFTQIYKRGSEISFDYTLKGDVYASSVEDNKKNLYQVDVKSKAVINLPYQDDKPVVKNSVNLKFITLEDFNTMFENAKEKYNVAGSYIYQSKESLLSSLFENVPTDDTSTVDDNQTEDTTTNTTTETNE